MSSFPFVTRPVELNTAQCLNLKHHEAACSRCSDVCPTASIVVNGSTVRVNLETCLGCGLCLHACPSEVFATNRWSERTPLVNAGDLQTERVDVFCTRYPDAQTGQREVGCVQIPTCLAAMSPGIWFEFGLKKSTQVRLDACVGCPLENTTSAVERSVDTANAWLHDAGHETRVACVRVADDSAPSGRRPVIDGEHVRTSRRGFFRSLFSAVKSTQDESAGVQAITWTGDDSPKQQPRLPSWMAYAAQAYAQHSLPSSEPTALWPAITINSACTHCNACTRYCPTGALKSTVSADSYALTFNSGQCVDCRICWASCPVGAITRSQQVTPEPFVRRPVLQRPVSSCVHCGQPAEAGREVCYWCAEEPPLSSVVTDARRWLFTASVAPVMDQTP